MNNSAVWKSLLIIFFCLAIAIIFLIYFVLPCFPPPEWMPEEGTWFCKELQIYIFCGSLVECHIVHNEEYLRCAWGQDRGSQYFYISFQEFHHDDFEPGQTIFQGKYVSLDDTNYVVEDINTGVQYVFVRENDR